MKKLLTMMVSCASALFAMADVTLSTAKVEFTDYGGVQPKGAAVDLDITKDDDGGAGDKYWYSASALANEGIAEAVVTNNGENAYLMLDTSDVLERTIKPWTQGETLNFVPQAIGTTGIYFDSMVQFTATEDNVTPSEGDKLVVWLKAVETEMNGEEVVTPGYTNLMITAGNGEDAYNKAIRADFVASVASGVSIEPISIKPNSWHQLTIKAFVDDEGATFFNVYIDKKLVTGVLNETQVTDFESLVSKAEEELNPTTITSVGFKGTGAVDDLLFTNENPLGQDVTITLNDDEGLCVQLMYGDNVLDLTSPPLKINVPAGTTEVTLKCYLVPGAVLIDGAKDEDDVVNGNVAWTWTGSITDNTIALTVQEAQDEPEPETGAFSIDGVGSFATLAEAIEAASANAKIVVAKGAEGNVTSYDVEGLMIEKSITIDLNGNTLVLREPAVGATDATKTLGIRIGGKAGAYNELINVTIKNGTITVAEGNTAICMLIQNYANLTLTDVEVNGTNLAKSGNEGWRKYVVSNNSGNVTLDGATSIIAGDAKEYVAFDAYGPFQSYVAPTVTLDTTGTIEGAIEIDGGNFVYVKGDYDTIEFNNGTIKGVEEGKITVVAEGKVLGKNDAGAWILVDKPAEPEPAESFTITVAFGDGIEGASYKIGEGAAVAFVDGVASEAIAAGTEVTITATAKDWFKAPEDRTITLDENKVITLFAEVVTSETIGDLEAEIPAEAAGDVLNWAKNSGMTTAQVLAAPYLYEDYLFNFTQPSQAKPTIEITSITLVDGVATVEAKVTVNGVAKIETLTSADGLNGEVMYKAAATLDALKTATPKAAIEKGDQFIQIVVE